MPKNAVKYSARALSAAALIFALVEWRKPYLQDKGIALVSAGLALLILAPTLPRDDRPLPYALGALLFLAGIALIAVALNGEARAALGAGIHDGRSVPPGDTTRALLPSARAEIVGWGVWLPGVPQALTPVQAAEILSDSLPPGALVEVDITDGIIDVWPDLQSELEAFGLQAIKTTRKP